MADDFLQNKRASTEKSGNAVVTDEIQQMRRVRRRLFLTRPQDSKKEKHGAVVVSPETGVIAPEPPTNEMYNCRPFPEQNPLLHIYFNTGSAGC
jgi:hypothetical protein